MNGWKLTYDGFDAAEEPLREALCALGNGYFATRGAAPESSADGVHYPGTYIAGCYNRLASAIADRTLENESLVNMPNWLPLNFRIDGGDWFDLKAVDLLSYQQELDIKQAVLTRTIHFRDMTGRHTRLEQQRFVSMDQPHLACLHTCIFAEDWEGNIEVRSALDGRVENTGVARYRELDSKHLTPLTSVAVDANTIALEVQTNQSHIRIAQAAKTRLWLDDEPIAPTQQQKQSDGYIAHCFTTQLTPSRKLSIEKTVAVYTSRDQAISDPGLEAREAVRVSPRFDELLRRHSIEWKHLWNRFDFDIEYVDRNQEEQAEKILRLHILHLIQTTSPHVIDLDVGVPARGLHGEAYRGHVFWDELFVFPLFNLRMPEITRALLRYRYRRLGEARKAAKACGFRGAMYPWQSGSDGREETQRLHLNPKSGNWLSDNSYLQRHINSAVAYNVWQYYQVTNDTEFLSFCGAEMILEIARFWASIA
ncbi:MAG: hypothetical protein GTO41_03445, partial [Burkholderiales bacterium]|nr:hypothetical protein [Burkholderiales bacterium]